MRPSDIPAYPFEEDALVGRGVRNYLPRMRWNWEPTREPALAQA